MKEVNNNTIGVIDLYHSLIEHRGWQLTTSQIANFIDFVVLLDDFNLYECMVCKEDDEDGPYITIDLLTDNELIIHLTQYFTDCDKITFSVEKCGKFLLCGYLDKETAINKIYEIVN